MTSRLFAAIPTRRLDKALTVRIESVVTKRSKLGCSLGPCQRGERNEVEKPYAPGLFRIRLDHLDLKFGRLMEYSKRHPGPLSRSYEESQKN